MITKRKMARGKVRVTFSVAPIDSAKQVNVVGEFNDWSGTANPMEKGKNGDWSATLTLEGGREYQFRYLADGSHWQNDLAADAYRPNEFGEDNSVINLKEDALPAAKSASRRKPL